MSAAGTGRAGAGEVRVRTEVTDAPLDLAAHVALLDDPRSGAIATFVGRVRDHDPDAGGRVVVGLEYSAHPDAPAVLARIVAGHVAAADVLGVAVSHRVGHLDVGETAIVVVVSTAHRGTAFDVCRALVDQVKAELPVWKREVFADGTHVWVGSL
jgi:molybdopterin synthase catalytic subunit